MTWSTDNDKFHDRIFKKLIQSPMDFDGDIERIVDFASARLGVTFQNRVQGEDVREHE